MHFYHEDITDARLSFILQSPVYERASTPDLCNFIIHHQILWDEIDTQQLLNNISDKNKKIDRFTIVFVVSDEEIPYRLHRNIIIIRTSLLSSLRRKNELVLPYIWEGSENPFAPSVYMDKPHVGFCGLMSSHRQKIIEAFQHSPAISSNFVIRDQFWGGAPCDPTLMKDFSDNMRTNPFIVCQRGNGNFSMRFYQTLAAGRIPVLVNTDMELPFSDRINWLDYIVFENNEIDCVRRVINLFDTDSYVQMQRNCGILFETFFSYTNFFNQLMVSITQNFRRPSTLFPTSGLSRFFHGIIKITTRG